MCVTGVASPEALLQVADGYELAAIWDMKYFARYPYLLRVEGISVVELNAVER